MSTTPTATSCPSPGCFDRPRSWALDAFVAVARVVWDRVIEVMMRLRLIDKPDPGQFQSAGVVEHAHLNARPFAMVVALPKHV